MCMQCQVNCPLDEPPDPGKQQRRSRQGSYCQCQTYFSGTCHRAETKRHSMEWPSDLYPLTPWNCIRTMKHSWRGNWRIFPSTIYEIPFPEPLNLGSTDPSSHCGAALCFALGRRGKLIAALHRDIQCMHNILARSTVTHISAENTVRAKAYHRQASSRAKKQARPKATLACIYIFYIIYIYRGVGSKA